MEKIFNKLVRDKIPELCLANGEKAVTRILSDDEYRIELMKKIGEELLEVRLANSKEELTRELADILEIILTLNNFLGNSEDDLYQARLLKLKTNGGFSQRLFLEKVIRND